MATKPDLDRAYEEGRKVGLRGDPLFATRDDFGSDLEYQAFLRGYNRALPEERRP
jgi:hypothetical protein